MYPAKPPTLLRPGAATAPHAKHSEKETESPAA